MWWGTWGRTPVLSTAALLAAEPNRESSTRMALKPPLPPPAACMPRCRANSGIGRDAALKLAAQGHRVHLACRTLAKASQAVEEMQAELQQSGQVRGRGITQPEWASHCRQDLVISHAPSPHTPSGCSGSLPTQPPYVTGYSGRPYLPLPHHPASPPHTSQAAAGGSLVPGECDLASLASVRAFADSWHASGERLDVLVCNAGVQFSGEGGGPYW